MALILILSGISAAGYLILLMTGLVKFHGEVFGLGVGLFVLLVIVLGMRRPKGAGSRDDIDPKA